MINEKAIGEEQVHITRYRHERVYCIIPHPIVSLIDRHVHIHNSSVIYNELPIDTQVRRRRRQRERLGQHC